MIHVCSLEHLDETVEGTGASHVVTLLRDIHLIARLPPKGIDRKNHLVVGIDDITVPLDGYTHPAEKHLRQLLDFVRAWDRAAPLVLHCYAGISRSTASAFTAVCALNPERDEVSIAQALRKASPTATPNELIVSLADRLLERDGRMISAIESIGRGETAFEARPFRLDLE
jgi:predicted protein tyrosine phosphatase